MPGAYRLGMASLLSSLFSKYDALDATGFPGSAVPPVFEDRAPEMVNGNQLYPPYTVMTLAPLDELLTFESDGIENYRLTITTYATTQADADQMAKAIRFNNQNPDQLAGFENCSTLAALTEGSLQSILLTRPPTPNLAGRGREGALIYKTVTEFAVSVQRS